MSRAAEIRLSAMNLLARREHSRQELKQKLSKRYSELKLIDEQLERLAEENLQSDSRFAESFVRQRYNRGHGPVRIHQEMRQRGVSDSDIQSALGSADYNWFASAQTVLKSKYGAMPASDVKEKARRNRFMQYRGFLLEHYGDYI